MELSRSEGGELYEQTLRKLCTDKEWAIFHRRLHPEMYPPTGFWQRLREKFRHVIGLGEA